MAHASGNPGTVANSGRHFSCLEKGGVEQVSSTGYFQFDETCL